MANVNPLKAFWDFVRQARSIRERVALAAIAAPIVDLLVCIGPPWPTREMCAIATVVAEFFVFMVCFELLHRKAKGRLQRWMLWGMAASVLFFAIYMYCFASLIHQAPDHFHRVVGGWSYTPEAIQHKERNPGITDSTLVADMGNDVEQVWTKGSLVLTRLIVLFNWLLLFTAVTFSFTVFLVLQRKSRTRSNDG